jgi:hypothetical protein
LDPFSVTLNRLSTVEIFKQPLGLNEKREYKLKFECPPNLGQESDYEIELRSIKIDSQLEYEMEIPPNCDISINQQKNHHYVTNP